MRSHYAGCMSDETCKCQDEDDEIEDDPPVVSRTLDIRMGDKPHLIYDTKTKAGRQKQT